MTVRPTQHCTYCGRHLPDDSPAGVCPGCHGLLEIAHPTPAEQGALLASRFARSDTTGVDAEQASGVWRFRSVVHPTAQRIISWPEGNTPLLRRDRLCRYTGCDGLALKHEGMNPTGSFKDRGMTVAVTQAARLQATAVGCASTGNTSASLAAYAALAGIPALVFVPEGQVALGKLTQTLAYGARTLVVRGDFDACLTLAREASERLGVSLLNSVNPWRLEGQKTIVLEALLQMGWDPPEWIALPAGNLGNTAAFGKALKEAHEWGLISRLPRLLLAQAEGAAPFFRGFQTGFSDRVKVKAETRATAIKIGDPASWDRAVAAVRLTNGVVTAVSDEAILEAKAEVDAAGVGCEPASAASVAGVRQLVRSGEIRASDRVLAVLTGHVLKDPGILLWYHEELRPHPARANRPVEISADIREVERILRR